MSPHFSPGLDDLTHFKGNVRSKFGITGPFKVIEMQIMDLADDIAYSTYDFEDALKAGFASPLDIIQQLNSNAEIREAVAAKLFKSEHHRDFPKENPSREDQENFDQVRTKMLVAVLALLKDYLSAADSSLTEAEKAISQRE